MITVATTELAGFSLNPFEHRWAPTVAGWVRDDAELRLLAPGTSPPLTPGKVLGWLRPGRRAMMLFRNDRAAPPEFSPADHTDDPSCPRPPRELPIGYGELNRMSGRPDHVWLGHVILRPDCRGRGWGERLVRSLVRAGWDNRTTRISLVVFPENTAAIECYRRVGFRMIGEEKHRFLPDQPFRKLLRMEITPNRSTGHQR